MIRRLILRLDSSSAARARLADYAALAEALGAELLAEIEDDERLSELAALGFMTEVSRASASVRRLDREHLAQRSEQLMRRLNAQLAQISRERPLRWSLIRRSHTAPPVHERDAAVLRVNTPVRLPRSPRQQQERLHMAVIDAGDDASARALEYARRISAHLGWPLLLLALPDSPRHRQHHLPPGVAVCTDLASIDSQSLKPMLRAWHVQLLLLPAEQLPAEERSGARYSQALGVPLLLTP